MASNPRSLPASLEEAHEEVLTLIKQFRANESRYTSPSYQEAEVRKDFVDKFFWALGWDVNHDIQTNPYEQEVKVEPSVTAGGQRRADYAFSLAPRFREVRFFVEAKKPHGELATPDNYFQTVRYAWNSQNPIAVLTDFRRLHVLDCRYKPDIGTALDRNLGSYSYTDFEDRAKFAEIYWLFSRQAVREGSIEKRTAELPKARNARKQVLASAREQSIDEVFLDDLDSYRIALAKSYKARNPELDGGTLTELVQRTLDRLVFLRFLEDKGIEQQYIVDGLIENSSPWSTFVAACRRLNNIYNGVVFRRHDILDSEDFQVDAKIFVGICRKLSHKHSPYDFDAIPIHILGSIYERFLGNVITATAKRVRVEPKPDVRKAGGVFYTPEHIVHYLVQQTVGILIDGKTPDQIAKMRFADIACGSGSFLLSTFSSLIEYHGKYYNNNPDKVKKGDCITVDEKLFLSLKKKREILQSNIFGVDIDAQAVEVCQLSLYLRLLKEETTGSAHQYQLDFAHTAHMKKLLPDLGGNILCGNSLVDTDIAEASLFPSEERALNPFSFESSLPGVMRAGGFTAIVGNPPYVFARDEGFSATEKKYFNAHYHHQTYQLNTYTLFTERSYKLLQRDGRLGFIIPNNWLSIGTMRTFRSFLLSSTANLAILNNRYKVFKGANVDTSLVYFTKGVPNNVTLLESSGPNVILEIGIVNPKSLLDSPTIRIRQEDSEAANDIIKAMDDISEPLSKVAIVKAGLKAYEVGKGTPIQTSAMKDQRIYHSTTQATKSHRPYLDGRDVRRYQIDWSGQYLKYGANLAAPRSESLFVGDRILVRQIPSHLPYAVNAAFVQGNEVNDINSMIVQKRDGYSMFFILGLLNSRLLSYWFDVRYDKMQRGIFPQFKVNELAQFPIAKLQLTDKADKRKHDAVVEKAFALTETCKLLLAARTDREKTFLSSKCKSLNAQLDSLVYELYGLSPTQSSVVEASGSAGLSHLTGRS
ncbi:MAG TPA: TaqI-like C-terminal specificity domain-containing protein [Acidobacteriaceae bacterium]